MDFPPELHDRVIDHLHGDKHALGTCGLVSQNWARSSRHHLFKSVTLKDATWESFLSLLDSPLATFMHSVDTLAIMQTVDLDSDSASPLDDIVPRLPRFPNVNCLRLANLAWDGISPLTAESLATLFDNITELDIHLVIFRDPREMATLISRFPRLAKTSARPIFITDGTHEVRAQFPDLPRSLVHVRMHCFNNDMHDPLSQLHAWLEGTSDRPSPVQSLEVGILPSRSLPSLGRVLRVLGPQLQALDLKLMYHVTADVITTHLDLTPATNLTHLTIHLSLRRFRLAPGPRNVLHAPLALLAAAAQSCPLLHTVTIVLTLDAPELIDTLDFVYLNTVLATVPLRRLRFIVHGHGMLHGVGVGAAIRARVGEWDAQGVVDVVMVHTARVFTHG
ncbi:hypothetical protein C8R46DRAFT_1196734 [Mycena filopes]|nr:hypothetical protein C8R46DRAFT_1196734 [Mycena filopes]